LRNKFIFVAAVVFLAAFACAQQNSQPNAALEGILSRMDATATNFRSAQADFTWDQYQKVVDETDKQAGKVYFRRQGKETEMAADITSPDQKYVLFTDSTVNVYQPKIDQVTKYGAGKDREAVESFLVLGFGGRGHDLQKGFNVTYDGMEQAQGVNAAKLTLQPKSQRVANVFNRIVLWIDPTRGVSVQQQFFEPSGNYRLTKYSNIQLNQRIPDSVFKLKTTSKTTIVTPSGL
jgi:outer membrane lipoprotein-sorting protein